MRAWTLCCFHCSEGADSVGGQLRGDKECPFSGVTSSGRVWRKVPESDARSVCNPMTFRLVCVWSSVEAVKGLFSFSVPQSQCLC